MKKFFVTLLGLVAIALACARPSDGPFYSATAFAAIKPGASFTEGKLAAIREAEKKARDQILLEALQLRFAGGQTLDNAAVRDPFIRAKVYDTIRTAKIADQTIDDKGTTVTVTVRLDLRPLQQILERYPPGPSL